MKKTTALAFAVLFAAAPVRAAGNMKLGPFPTKVTLQTEQKNDSNIYLTKSNETDSWINQTGIGVDFDLFKNDRHSVVLGYKADFLSYTEKPKSNNAVHQTANLGLACKAPSGLSFNLTDAFQDTTDPAASELVERERRFQNDAALGVGYKAESGFGYGLTLGHAVHNYDSSALSAQLDRSEYRAGLNLSYPLGGKTNATFGYGYSAIEYVDDDVNLKNSQGHEATLGVDGQVAPKVTGTADVGYNTREYDDEVAGIRNSFSTASYGLKLLWAAAEKTSVGLSGKRGFAEAIFGINRFYTSSTVALTVNQKLGHKLTAKLLGTYELDAYPEDATIGAKTDKREDSLTQAGLNLDYDVQEYFKVGASYLLRSRSSNFSVFDYTDGIAGVNLKLLF